MTFRFQKALLLIFFTLSLIALFFSSKSASLDALASHYASYHASYPIHFKGLRFSSTRSVVFDSITLGENGDPWHLQIILGRIAVNRTSDVFSEPRKLYYSFEKIQIQSPVFTKDKINPELYKISGYVIVKNSDIRINLGQAELENIHLKGGVLFVSGELRKANILAESPGKIADYLGAISQYLETLKSENARMSKVKVTYAGHQIILRGSRKPIVSFSWSPNQ